MKKRKKGRKLFIENKKQGYENLKNFPQLLQINKQYLQKIYEDNIKDLSDEEKLNIFDRKINNVKLEEK